MRIAFLHNLPSGGARRASYYQVKILAEQGHQITEFTLSTGDIQPFSFAPIVQDRKVFPFNSPGNYPHRIIGITPYIHLLQGLSVLNSQKQVMAKMANEIDDNHFDFVFAADSQVMACPYALRFLQTPSIFFCHGLERPYHLKRNYGWKDTFFWPAYYLFKNKYVKDEFDNAQAANKIITNSNHSSRLLGKLYHRKIAVNRPGVDTGVFLPMHLEKQDFVLCVGEISKQKGYRFIIESIGKLDRSIRPSLLAIANHIDENELNHLTLLARQRGVTFSSKTVTNDDQMVEIYNKACVFVYAPYNEALGLAPLEAMACGTPVVAVGEGGVIETVPNCDGAWVVKRDIDAFAQKLHYVLVHHDYDREYLRNYVLQCWNWDNSMSELNLLIDDVLKSEKGIS